MAAVGRVPGPGESGHADRRGISGLPPWHGVDRVDLNEPPAFPERSGGHVGCVIDRRIEGLDLHQSQSLVAELAQHVVEQSGADPAAPPAFAHRHPEKFSTSCRPTIDHREPRNPAGVGHHPAVVVGQVSSDLCGDIRKPTPGLRLTEKPGHALTSAPAGVPGCGRYAGGGLETSPAAIGVHVYVASAHDGDHMSAREAVAVF